VVFVSPPTAKQKKGSVVITVKGCASQTGGSPPVGSCTNQGNSASNASTAKSQVFLGFRVPLSVKAPSSFTGTPGPTVWKSDLHFTFSKAYTSELQRLAKAPSRQKWVGYTSQAFSYNSTAGEQNFTAAVSFALASPMGTFKYQVVIGGRQQNTSIKKLNPKEPIDCQNSLTTGYSAFHSAGGTPGEDWICVDDSFSSSLKLH
jgi:hypothetical protein